MGCAVFNFAWQQQTLLILLLLLPFIDSQWQIPDFRRYENQWLYTSILLSLLCFLVFLQPDYIETIIFVLLFTAIPEEWFFRGYFMQRLEVLSLARWEANVITSLLFALLHFPTQGWQGLSVFFPSLIFGWLYQRNRDLVLVILLHTFFNGIYIIYLRDMFDFRLAAQNWP